MRTTDLAKVRAADELRANSKLTLTQYRDPVLGVVFLAYVENRFEAIRADVESKTSAQDPATVADYEAKSVLYVPDESRLSHLVGLPEGDDIDKAVDGAIKAIEATPELNDVLPRGYQKTGTPDADRTAPALRAAADAARRRCVWVHQRGLPLQLRCSGRRRRVLHPYSIVRLIGEILEPFQGRVFDPTCDSGGMFVQCTKFVERHHESVTRKLLVFGTEKTEDKVPLAKMNLALHGLSGDRCSPLGLPNADNRNYLWIQQFYAALAPAGTPGSSWRTARATRGDRREQDRRRCRRPHPRRPLVRGASRRVAGSDSRER